jgi:hypothetical protein
MRIDMKKKRKWDDIESDAKKRRQEYVKAKACDIVKDTFLLSKEKYDKLLGSFYSLATSLHQLAHWMQQSVWGWERKCDYSLAVVTL